MPLPESGGKHGCCVGAELNGGGRMWRGVAGLGWFVVAGISPRFWLAECFRVCCAQLFLQLGVFLYLDDEEFI